MAYRLNWSPSARLDLRALTAYIAERDPLAARRFARKVFQVIERLSDFPCSGRVVPELDDQSIREVIQRPCRIVYRVVEAEERVEIARVWHAARGAPRLG